MRWCVCVLAKEETLRSLDGTGKEGETVERIRLKAVARAAGYAIVMDVGVAGRAQSNTGNVHQHLADIGLK